MYTRYQNYRFGSKVRVPENYSGNAFSSDPASENPEDKDDVVEKEAPPPSSEAIQVDRASDGAEESAEVSVIKQNDKRIRLPSFKFDAGRLFSGGFGSEELLIIALILLISQGDNDDDIVLLLALLLFIR